MHNSDCILIIGIKPKINYTFRSAIITSFQIPQKENYTKAEGQHIFEYLSTDNFN